MRCARVHFELQALETLGADGTVLIEMGVLHPTDAAVAHAAARDAARAAADGTPLSVLRAHSAAYAAAALARAAFGGAWATIELRAPTASVQLVGRLGAGAGGAAETRAAIGTCRAGESVRLRLCALDRLRRPRRHGGDAVEGRLVERLSLIHI